MDDSLKRTGTLITSLLYVILPILMGLKEYSLLLPNEVQSYLLGRLIIILVSGSYFILTLSDKTPSHFPIALYLIGLTYSIHGQYYQPNYWLAMMELNALFPLFFLLNKKVMFGLYGLGLVSFNISFFYFSERFIKTGAFSSELRADIIIGTVITAGIALVTYNNLIMARSAKNRLLQRFVDVGKNFSFIIHDLKGMISTPTIYASLIQRSIESNDSLAKEQTLIKQLSEDLNSINTFVTETTRLVAADFSNDDKRAFIKVSEATHLVKILLKTKLQSIQVIQEGDLDVGVKLELLNRVFINVLSNSVDALVKSKINSARITISCHTDRIQISDNSGTRLSPDDLRKLNSSDSSYTSKSHGSGLGTLIVRDYMGSVGGSVKYSNGIEGVIVSLQFPKKALKQGAPVVTQDFHKQATL